MSAATHTPRPSCVVSRCAVLVNTVPAERSKLLVSVTEALLPRRRLQQQQQRRRRRMAGGTGGTQGTAQAGRHRWRGLQPVGHSVQQTPAERAWERPTATLRCAPLFSATPTSLAISIASHSSWNFTERSSATSGSGPPILLSPSLCPSTALHAGWQRVCAGRQGERNGSRGFAAPPKLGMLPPPPQQAHTARPRWTPP